MIQGTRQIKLDPSNPLPCAVYKDNLGRACGQPALVADLYPTDAEPDEPLAGYFLAPICADCLAGQKTQLWQWVDLARRIS